MTRSRNPSLNDQGARARISNLRRLVIELRAHPMSPAMMAALLGFGMAGTDKYVRDLREAGLIERVRGDITSAAARPFKLVDDAGRVQTFLDNLDKGIAPRQSGRGHATLPVTSLGRRFHILPDDEPYHVKVSRLRIPQHEPVHAAFFGLAQEQRV